MVAIKFLLVRLRKARRAKEKLLHSLSAFGGICKSSFTGCCVSRVTYLVAQALYSKILRRSMSSEQITIPRRFYSGAVL